MLLLGQVAYRAGGWYGDADIVRTSWVRRWLLLRDAGAP